jgi:glucose/arabinose dehydrogenase
VGLLAHAWLWCNEAGADAGGDDVEGKP